MTRRSASAALQPLDAVLRSIRETCRNVAPLPTGLDTAIGAICAADARAGADRPVRPTALRDGWAVASAAVFGASPYAPVRLARAAIRVEAGDALPPGADTVLAPEAVEAGEVVADAPAGEGTRAAGAELAAGDPLAVAGTRLTALQALALGADGWREIAVRRPRIRLVATGPGGEARAVCGLLAALIGRAGARVAGLVAAEDSPEAIADTLVQEGADAVFVVGGTGFGRSDHSGAVLARAGRVVAHGIALRPCETAGFGIVADRPVLLLPGRPEAALAAFLGLGRPLLAALAGADVPAGDAKRLRRKVASTIGLGEIVFVRRVADGVEPLGGADLPLRRLVLADGAILAPPEREGYPEGAWVEVMPL